MAFCKECGTQVNGAFCPNCGTPMKSAPAPAAPAAPPAPKRAGGFFSAAGNLDGSPKAPAPTPVTPPPAPKPFVPVTPPAPKPVVPVTPPAPKPVVPVTPPAPKPFVPVTPPPAPRISPPEPAPYSPAPARKRPHRRISAGRELKLLLRQGFLVLMGEKRNLIISMLFPLLAAIVTVWIAGEEMFLTYESTKSACFVLVCAAIWCGLFNSIQTIVKERSNIKRDYVSGALRIECYMASRGIIQTILCLIQSFILALSVPMMDAAYDAVKVPAEGLLGNSVFFEFFISLFLVMLASDAMGLMISSFVKKEEVASKLAPYILIAQLLFSGVLFTLEGAADIFSYIMISRWGMGALGSICKLNQSTTATYLKFAGECDPSCRVLGGMQHPKSTSVYEATSGHLLSVFFIMLVFVVVSLVAANVLLHKVKKDGRD